MKNLNMPKLGFGGMRFPTLGNESEVDLKLLGKMVDHYMDSGFNYFDTAYVYHGGNSETALADALVARRPRGSFILADKMSIWEGKTAEDLEGLFTTQLKRCRVEYFDCYLIHSINVRNEEKVAKSEAYDYLSKLKKEGRARYIGFSFHGTAEVLERVLTAHPEVDFVQLQLNYYDMLLGRATEYYQIALKHNKPVIAMEPVKGGLLAKLPENVSMSITLADAQSTAASLALRYVASLPGVVTTLSGMSTLAQVEENCETFKDFKQISDGELRLIESALVELGKSSSIPCTACKYCLQCCPNEIDIPVVFSIYNAVKSSGVEWNGRAMYNLTPKGRRAVDCADCGQCVNRCPQEIAIPEEMKNVAGMFS